VVPDRFAVLEPVLVADAIALAIAIAVALAVGRIFRTSSVSRFRKR